MFDLTEERVAWIDVKWRGFVSDGETTGRPVEHKIGMKVAFPEKPEFDRIFTMPDAEEDPEGFKAWMAADEVERLMTVCRDWRDIAEGGKPIPFTAENLRRFLALPNAARGWNQSYAEAYSGIGDIREKN